MVLTALVTNFLRRKNKMLGLVSCVLSCLTAKLENGKSKKKYAKCYQSVVDSAIVGGSFHFPVFSDILALFTK